MTTRRWHQALGLLAVLAFGLHAAVINHSYAYDDHVAIESNPTLEAPLDVVAHLKSGFWGPEYAQTDAAWRPFTTLTLSWNRAVHGLAPAGTFFVNGLLNSVAVVLLALLACALGMRREWAFAAAALFAVHPLHIEAIAPGVGRADLLMTVASFAALLAWERKRWALALVALAIAMLSKEMGAMIALVLVWRAWTGDGLALKAPATRHWLMPLAVLGAWLLARYWALGAIGNANPGYLENPLVYEGVATRVLTAGALYSRALELFFVPLRLIADYSYAAFPPSGVSVASVAGLLLLAATAGATVLLALRRPQLSFMLALWIGPYLLVSHLGPTLPMVFAERVLYLPSAGLCLLAAQLCSGWRWERPAAAAVFGVCVLFAWRSHERLKVWESDQTLWTQTAKDSPRSVKTLCNAARMNAALGNYDDAIEFGKSALAISDRTATPHICLAELYVATGKPELAAPLIKQAAQRQPDPKAFRLLQCAFASRFEVEQAIAHCEAAIAGTPRNPSAYMYLAIAHDREGRAPAAEGAFKAAIEQSGGTNAMLYFNYGSFLANHRQLPEAAEILARAHVLAPENTVIKKRLDRIRADLGR